MVDRKHPLAECERCPLYERGTYVASKPPQTAPNSIAFIGESPGKTEKAKKEPFVGASGRLLNRLMEEHGIERNASLLTNGALCNYRDEDKDDLPGAIDACRPRLLAELQEHEISVAVTLGNTAVSSLYETKVGITKLRGGPPKDSTYLDGLKVVPTLHPAAALRRQDQTPLLLRDIGKAVSGPPPWAEPVVRVITEPHEALRVLRSSSTKYPLVVDTESAWDKDTSFTRNTNILCVGIGSTAPSNGDRVVVIGRPAITNPTVQREFLRLVSRVGMVAQNAKYDWHVLNAINKWKFDIRTTYDTMLASYSLHEVPGVHGLKYMANEYLGMPHYEEEIAKYLVKFLDPPERRQAAIEYVLETLSKQEWLLRADVHNESPPDTWIVSEKTGKVSYAAIDRAAKELGVVEFKGEPGEYKAHQLRWRLPAEPVLIAPYEADGTFASIPPEILHEYNAYDVQATRLLRNYFVREQVREGLIDFNTHLVRMSNTLARVEANGLYVDLPFNAQLGEQFGRDIDSLSKNFTINPGSPMQLKLHLKEVHGVTVEKTDEETLVVLSEHPKAKEDTKNLAKDILSFRKAKKYKSTYVDSVRDKAIANGGVIYPSFVINQATTGRLASKNPNVQNMPRLYDIKRQFIPSSPDMVFVHADYSQLELRTITWLAQDSGMRDLFNDPERDVFDELTIGVHGMDRQAFYDLKASDPVTVGEMRVAIKSFAYGILFSRSAAGIAADPDMNITEAEATRQMGLFMRQIPGIMQYQDEVKAKIHRGEDLVNPFGRKRRFHLITDMTKHELERQAVSFMPQSTASDICVTACGDVVDAGERVVNIIHDAILWECHKDRIEESARFVIRTMIDTAERVTGGYVKFDVDATFGDNWQDAAKAKKDGSNVVRL